MLKGVFGRPTLFAVILSVSVAFASSNAFAQHHGGGGGGGGHAGGGHMGGSHMGGSHMGGMGGGSMHHGGSHYGGYGGGFGGIGIGIGSYGLGGFGYSGFGGYGGLGYSSLSLGYGGYGNYGYSGYSPYSSYGSYAPQYYSARPVTSVYIAPTYSYAQPQAYSVQGYSTQMPAQVNPSAPGSDLRPGMVLPDGAVVTSVGPIQ
jgi:hypothetical protein